MSKLHMICTFVMVLLLGSTATFGISFYNYAHDDGGSPEGFSNQADVKIWAPGDDTYNWTVDLDVAVSAQITTGTGFADAYAQSEVRGPIDNWDIAESATRLTAGLQEEDDFYCGSGSEPMTDSDYLHLLIEYDVDAAYNSGGGYAEAVAFTSATGDIW